MTDLVESGARPKGSPMLLVLLAVTIGPAVLLGSVVGAGPAAIVGAFVALVALMMSAGGPLWADLRTLAAYTPVLAFAAMAPRLLNEVSRPAAFGLVTILVVVAALLPLVSLRFSAAGMGLGMLTLLAFGLPLSGSVGAGQLAVATVAGLVVALVLRLLMGVADPTSATRAAVGGVFDDQVPAFTVAFDRWLSDGRRRWLGEALIAGYRFRVALRSAEVLSRQRTGPDRALIETALDQARSSARQVADLVRAKKAETGSSIELADRRDEQAAGTTKYPAGVERLFAEAHAALDQARSAARTRDSTAVVMPEGLVRRLKLQVLGPGLLFRSIQLRHALRTGLGVLLALLISLRLPQGDPLVPTLLLSTFAVLQASWRETLAKARPRIIGLVAGAVAAIAIIRLVPSGAMMAITVLALVVALWNLTARPVVGFAALLCMSVGLNSTLRHLDPDATLIEYVVLSVLALLLGVVVGFAVIPGVPHRSLNERVDEAMTITARSIRAVIRERGSEAAASRSELLALHRDAVFARQQLVPDHDRLTDEQLADLDRLRLGLTDLAALSLVAAFDTQADRTSVERALDSLENASAGPNGQAPEGNVSLDDTDGDLMAAAFMALAGQLITARRSLTVSRTSSP